MEKQKQTVAAQREAYMRNHLHAISLNREVASGHIQ